MFSLNAILVQQCQMSSAGMRKTMVTFTYFICMNCYALAACHMRYQLGTRKED